MKCHSLFCGSSRLVWTFSVLRSVYKADLVGDLVGDLAGELVGELVGDLAGDLVGDLVGDLFGRERHQHRNIVKELGCLLNASGQRLGH